MHCAIRAQLCAATVSASISSEKGAGNRILSLCMQAALDKLHQLICQQHHLPPIAAVRHLQEATATPEADGAALSSVDQVQHTLAFIGILGPSWHQGPMLTMLGLLACV